jgi:hypothetical protein
MYIMRRTVPLSLGLFGLLGLSCVIGCDGTSKEAAPGPRDSGKGSMDAARTSDAGQGSMDGPQTETDSGQGSPDGGQTSPEGSQGSPDGGQVSPDGGQNAPDGGQTSQDAGYLGQNELTPITYDGNNSVSFAQLPGQVNNFLGRYLLGQQGSNWAIANYTMSWTAQPEHLTFTGYAFLPPQTIVGGHVVTTSYDATVASFGGEVWAAFECGGSGFIGASTCVGPYNTTSGLIDPTRTTVAIDGQSAIPGDTYGYSASVPKLLAFQGNLYVYWTVVKQQLSNAAWVNLTSRGAQLEETSGQMWVAGTTATISSNDPARTIEVWGLGTSSESNLTADMQGVFTDGQHVFATAGLGGNAGGQTCLTPLVGNAGCYRLAISRSLSPLGPEIFSNGDQLGDDHLISNSQDYTRAFTAPDGSLNLMAILYGASAGAPDPVTPGYYRYPVSNIATYFEHETAPAGAQFFGSMSGQTVAAPIVGMAATPDGDGYWLVGSDGGVFNYGDAVFKGSMGGMPLNAPIVGMAAAPNGQGYWLVGSDGGVYSFGAPFYGSMGGKPLNKPIVGMAAGNGGYWLVGSDGGIFSFPASLPFYGSTGGMTLNKPIVGMAAAPSGAGYWLVASDGGIFSFPASLPFYGSTGGMTLAAPIVGMAVSPGGKGYWLVGSDGGIFNFGAGAAFRGSMGGQGLGASTVGVAPSAGGGYWVAGKSGSIYNF